MIGAVEDAIQARLRDAGAAAVLGYQYAKLDSYPVALDDYILSETPRYPAAWVVWGGWNRPSVDGPGTERLPCVFTLVLGAENLRNETSTRHGAAGKPGSYQLLMDAVALLANQSLGLDIDEIKIGAARSLYNSAIQKKRNVNLVAVELHTAFYVGPMDGVMPTALGVGDFANFHVDWELGLAHAGAVDADRNAPGVQLPDPAHADTAQDIVLPIAPGDAYDPARPDLGEPALDTGAA